MAISPDLLPITAACTGLVFGRGRLVWRGLAALIVGLGTAGVLAVVVSVFLDQLDLLPKGFSLHEFSAAQTHVNTTTILVALAAGVAGMLVVETRASSVIGVAISVTTIPATAYLGVALGIGELRTSLSGLAVLAVNIAMMVTGRVALNGRSPQYELIEPLSGPSIHADWLEELGEGFHHVGYVVTSLQRTTAEMEAAGHPPSARIHSFGADGDGAAASYDTADGLGFLVEAVEPPARMPPTDFTL